MTLMKCYECGKEVSSLAEKCPHCGAPIVKKETVDKPFFDKPIDFSDNRKILIILGIIFLFIIILIVVALNITPSGVELIEREKEIKRRAGWYSKEP